MSLSLFVKSLAYLSSLHFSLKFTYLRFPVSGLNNFFRQDYLSDTIFSERVREEINMYIARNAKGKMAEKDRRSCDETTKDEIETEDTNLEFLYNLIEETYFIVN